ncbi:MAG: hypothetical protein QM504_04050 [Pseudomonadota bacterium]
MKDKYFIEYKNKIVPLLLIVVIVLYGTLAKWTVINNTIVDNPIRADALDYFLYAKNLSSFSTYSRERTIDTTKPNKDALRSPGFPYFASLFYSGENKGSVVAVLKAQTILQSFCFVLLSVLCWFSFGAWMSVVISLLVWTHPAFMSINTYYLTESLFQSSLILIVVTFALAIKNFQLKWSYFLLLGVFLGFSALIRPTMEYYILFLGLILLLFFRDKIRWFFPTFVSFLLIILAWKIRNYFSLGYFSDPTLMINGLFHGSYPNFIYNNMPESYGFPYRFDPQASEYYQGVTTTLELIWTRAIEQPLEYLSWYFAGKQFYLWQWNILAGAGDVFIYPVVSSPINYQSDLQFWHKLHHTVNAPIMLMGILYSYYVLIKNTIIRQAFHIEFIIASLVVYASLFHIVVAPFPRYGIPFKVFVFIMFILLIQRVIVTLKNKVWK